MTGFSAAIQLVTWLPWFLVPIFTKKSAKNTLLKSFSISIKGLHLLKQSLGSTLVLIETPKGILTLAESLKKNVSGKIILIVN